MVWQRLNKPEIQDLLGLRKGFFGVERPHLISCTLRLGFEKSQNDYHNDNNQQQQNPTHFDIPFVSSGMTAIISALRCFTTNQPANQPADWPCRKPNGFFGCE